MKWKPNQLTYRILEDHQMHLACRTIGVMQVQLRHVRAQLRRHLTIQMVLLTRRLRAHFRRTNQLPLVDLQF